MADARKLFRLFKSLIEYKKINEILGKADTMPMHKFVMALIVRVCFFCFWMLDHLVVLHKIKFTTQIDIKWVTHKWASFWLVANTVNIISSVTTLVELAKDEAKLVAQKRFQQSNCTQKAADEFRQKEKDIAKKRFDAYLMIIKSLGDNITASAVSGYAKKWFNIDWNDGFIGCGGLTSALISCYNAYPAAKK